jgi:MFS family permease
MPGERRHELARWVCIYALCGFTVLSIGCVSKSLPWIELDLRDRMHLDDPALEGALLACPMATAVAGRVAVGWLSDRVDRALALIVFAAASAALHASLSWVSSNLALVLLWLCMGFFDVGTTGVLLFLFDLVPIRRRGLLLGLLHFPYPLGGYLFLGMTAVSTGPNLALLAAVPLGVCALLFVPTRLALSPGANGPQLLRPGCQSSSDAAGSIADGIECSGRGADARATGGVDGGAVEAEEASQVGRRASGPLRSCPCGVLCAAPLRANFALFATMWAAWEFGYKTNGWFLLRYLHDSGLADHKASLLATEFGCQLAGSLLGALMADRFSRRRLVHGSFVLSTVAAGALWLLLAAAEREARARLLFLVYAMAALMHTCLGLGHAVLPTLTAEAFPSEYRGLATGACNGVGRLGATLSLLTGPAALEQSSQLPFALSAAGFAMAAAACHCVSGRRGRTSSLPSRTSFGQ